MARWLGKSNGPIKPPSWYRTFDAAMWDEPDERELLMTGGVVLTEGELHEYHAQRRWHEAQFRYRAEHPLLAEQEFREIISRHQKRRRG